MATFPMRQEVIYPLVGVKVICSLRGMIRHVTKTKPSESGVSFRINSQRLSFTV